MSESIMVHFSSVIAPLQNVRNDGNCNKGTSIMVFGNIEGGGCKAHNRRLARVTNNIDSDNNDVIGDGVRQNRKITPIKWVTAGEHGACCCGVYAMFNSLYVSSSLLISHLLHIL